MKNPQFWEVETNGNQYVVTEGVVGGESTATSKEFPNEAKLLIAVAKLVDKIRDKGYMEDLPEYSEWSNAIGNLYAIWRNGDAVKFLLKTLRENTTVKFSETSPDKVFGSWVDKADDMEIYLDAEQIELRTMAPRFLVMFRINIYLNPLPWLPDPSHITVVTPRFEDMELVWDSPFRQLVIDYFVRNGKGKWVDKDAEKKELTVDRDVRQTSEQVALGKYLKKLKSIVNECYGKFNDRFAPCPLQIKLSMEEGKTRGNHIYYGTPQGTRIENDIVFVILEYAKSKLKNEDYNDTLAKTCYMLRDVEQPLPMVKLKAVFEELKAGGDVSTQNLYKDLVFEDWEKSDSRINLKTIMEHI